MSVLVQVQSLRAGLLAPSENAQTKRAEGVLQAQEALVVWLAYFADTHGSRSAGELLAGARAACVEAAAYSAIGLGRAAVSAMRTQVDLVLSYTYFRDHPVEWNRLVDAGEGFMLRSNVHDYHKGLDGKFESRLAMLDNVAKDRLVDLYRLMSAHVHGQSPLTLPTAQEFVGLVSEAAFSDSLPELQERLSVALSHYLVAIHARRWADLPSAVVAPVRTLLAKPETQGKFFGGGTT